MASLDDYRDREHWSFSALNQFLNICSLQFAFDRVYRMEKTFTPVSLAFGSAFHRALEWLHLSWMDGETPTETDAGERFRDFWARQLQDEPDIRLEPGVEPDDYAGQGAGLVAAFLKAADPGEQVLAVNRAFAVPLIDAQGQVLEKPMVGEIDLIVRTDGGDTLVDWKTSARRWPKDQADKSLQPTVYAYAYRQLCAQDVPMRFDVAVKNKTPIIERYLTTRSPDQFQRMVELVKRVERMIAAEHFLPNEQGFYCAGCPHQAACKAWHREQARVSVRMAA